MSERLQTNGHITRLYQHEEEGTSGCKALPKYSDNSTIESMYRAYGTYAKLISDHAPIDAGKFLGYCLYRSLYHKQGI